MEEKLPYIFTFFCAILPAALYCLFIRKKRIERIVLKSGYICGIIIMLAGLWWLSRLSLDADSEALGCPLAIVFSGFATAFESFKKLREK